MGLSKAMTRFVTLRSVPRALCLAALVLSVMGPLAGCGSLGNPFRSGGHGPSRKVGRIQISVAWPVRAGRLIPDASNSIVVNIKDSQGRNAPGFPKTLVRPSEVSGSGTAATATTSAVNLEVGQPSTPETYSISASAYPNADGTGVAQSSGGTAVKLDTDNPDAQANFTLGSTIRSVTISITDGSTSIQNLGKDRTRAYIATALDANGKIVLTTAAKWKWEILNGGIGTFQGGSGASYIGNGSTYVAGDPGNAPQDVTLKVTETEASDSDPANPSFYTITTAVRVVPMGLATTEWPRFHGSAQNLGTGTSGTAIASAVSAVWSGPAKVGPKNVVFSSGVVDANGVLYIGAYDEVSGTSGRIFAIAPDGTLKWSYVAKGRIESSPVISRDGTIYFGSYDDSSVGGYLYAIKNNAAGTAAVDVWIRQMNGPVFGTPAVDKNGYLYAGTGGADKALYKLDSLNGKFVANWKVQADTAIQTSPALSTDESSIYVISAGDTLSDGSRIGANLYAVNTATGAIRWTYATGDKSVTMSSPVVVNGRVFFGTLEGLFFAVNESNGTDAWTLSYDAEAQIYSTAAVSPDGLTLYFATFDNVSGIDNNRVIALDAATGNVVWSTAPFSAGFTSSPAVSADGTRLYIGGYDGNIHGINTVTGSVAWTFKSGVANENFDSSPCIGPNGDVFIGSYTGDVYRLH